MKKLKLTGNKMWISSCMASVHDITKKTVQCTVGKYGGSVYIMITNNASFAPYKLNIVLLIAPQGLQLRIWFKRHVKAGKMPEKMRPALQFYVQSELRSPISPSFPECTETCNVKWDWKITNI